MRFADPKNDLAFKKIFGNEAHKEILISLLNS
ncbi:MAG: PD-(D/E)XK nuclease family transposase, partial [Colwellia sp.]|nr:PD-(D/E)XK nuclease family transposase [Colwellia sp.]